MGFGKGLSEVKGMSICREHRSPEVGTDLELGWYDRVMGARGQASGWCVPHGLGQVTCMGSAVWSNGGAHGLGRQSVTGSHLHGRLCRLSCMELAAVSGHTGEGCEGGLVGEARICVPVSKQLDWEVVAAEPGDFPKAIRGRGQGSPRGGSGRASWERSKGPSPPPWSRPV